MIDLTFPVELNDVDVVRATFTLEFQEECALDLSVFLGLRSSLRAAARLVLEPCGPDGRRRFKALFEPELSRDPVALKKFQKPSVPFVLMLKPFPPRMVNAGSRFDLEVLFLGRAVPLADDFLACLQQLGHFGVIEGRGRFDVVQMTAIGEDDAKQCVWQKSDPSPAIAPPLDTIGSWLERQGRPAEEVHVDFRIPARLLVGGRPLRRPVFREIFPFMLRRATSMLHAHADCEPVQDVESLLNAAAAVTVESSHFRWHDWRELSGNRSTSSIGGFTGCLFLRGAVLAEIYWVFAVAALLGIGKGAAYGAGRFVLSGAGNDRDGRV